MTRLTLTTSATGLTAGLLGWRAEQLEKGE